MFVFEILIYVIFAWIMYSFWLDNLKVSNQSHNPMFNRYVWMSILFFTFICAIRWRVGVDSPNYAASFMVGLNDYSEVKRSEIIWGVLIDLIHSLGLHFTIGMGVVAFLQIYFITRTLYKYPYILVMLPIVLFGSHYYLDLMNGMRQMTVACVFFWATQFIIDRKWIKYSLTIAICSFIHHSAILLLPLYLLNYVPRVYSLLNKRLVCLAIFVGCFVLGLLKQFQDIVQYAEHFTIYIGYDSYAERVNMMLNNEYEEGGRNFGPMQMSYFLCAIICIWKMTDIIKKYGEKIPYIKLWILFSFLYSCSYFLLCNVSSILLRPVDYFALFHMFLICVILADLKNRRNKNMLYLFVLIIWVNTSWNIYKACTKTDASRPESTTYKVFFLHENEFDYYKRRKL